jgi:hypothetical protein
MGYTAVDTGVVVLGRGDEVIAERTFVSGPPPSSAAMRWDAEGALPVKKVLAWVERMARR